MGPKTGLQEARCVAVVLVETSMCVVARQEPSPPWVEVPVGTWCLTSLMEMLLAAEHERPADAGETLRRLAAWKNRRQIQMRLLVVLGMGALTMALIGVIAWTMPMKHRITRLESEKKDLQGRLANAPRDPPPQSPPPQPALHPDWPTNVGTRSCRSPGATPTSATRSKPFTESWLRRTANKPT